MIVWWCFVEIMPIIIVAPAIAGTVFEREAELNGLGHISNVSVSTLMKVNGGDGVRRDGSD